MIRIKQKKIKNTNEIDDCIIQLTLMQKLNKYCQQNISFKCQPISRGNFRKASKQINDTVNEYEKKYAVQDKQDSLAMCALQIISQSENFPKVKATALMKLTIS